jgi:hypothetical protein
MHSSEDTRLLSEPQNTGAAKKTKPGAGPGFAKKIEF